MVPGVVESLKIITENASTRIGKFAFEYAVNEGLQEVTSIHKDQHRRSSVRWPVHGSVCEGLARHPDIAYDEKIVDAACMHLVMKPEQFDVLVMPNLYGDIVSDSVRRSLVGLGVVGAANLGTDVAVFQLVHGSAPDITRQELRKPDGAAALGRVDAAAASMKMQRRTASWPRCTVLGAGTTLCATSAAQRLPSSLPTRCAGQWPDPPCYSPEHPCWMTSQAVWRAGGRQIPPGRARGAQRPGSRTHLCVSRGCMRRMRPNIYRALRCIALPDSPQDRTTRRKPTTPPTRCRRIVVYASNHKSHTDYLVEPLVLDDNGIRPPLIAASINLFGGPLGLIHSTSRAPFRFVATPAIRRTHHAPGVCRRTPETARHLLLYRKVDAVTAELKAAKTGLIHATLQAECPDQ